MRVRKSRRIRRPSVTCHIQSLNCRFRSTAASMRRSPGPRSRAGARTIISPPTTRFASAAGRYRRSERRRPIRRRSAPRCAIPARSPEASNCPTDRRQKLSSRSIFFPCAFRGLAKARGLSPAITSRSSTARGRRTRSTRCRSIAGRPICSSAAPRRVRPACPTRARCSARSAAASWCPITTAARSRMARLPAAGSKSAT